MRFKDPILPRRWHAIVLGAALVLGVTACSSAPRRPGPDGQLVAATPGADTPAVRAEFRVALGRVGQAGPVPPDPPALRAYALYPYLVAARLQTALADQPTATRVSPLDAPIAAFLQRHASEPVARALAHDWLVDLAMRRQWSAFLTHVSGYAWAGDDPTLTCDTLSAQLATAALDTSQALAVWSRPVRQPTACDAVFGWLQQQGLLTPERLEAKARAALARCLRQQEWPVRSGDRRDARSRAPARPARSIRRRARIRARRLQCGHGAARTLVSGTADGRGHLD